MNVRQIMNKTPVSIQPTDSLQEAAKKMMTHNVGSVLVLDENSKLKGILTDRDITMSLAENSKDVTKACACDAMVQDPISIASDADMDSALRIMSKANIRRLPVTETGKVIGVVSTADIAVAMKQQLDMFIGLEEAFARH